MQIDISGHHLEVTDAIRSSVQTKLNKVASHYPDLTSFTVILTVEKQTQKIEVSTQYLGEQISVRAGQSDLYAAIADAAKKLESALSHRKGAVKKNKYQKPDLTDVTNTDAAGDNDQLDNDQLDNDQLDNDQLDNIDQAI